MLKKARTIDQVEGGGSPRGFQTREQTFAARSSGESFNERSSLDSIHQSENGDRRGSVSGGLSGKLRRPRRDELHQLTEELRGGFVGSLRSKLADVEKALVKSHEQAIGMAMGHEDAVFRVLTEAGRLRMENERLRAQMGSAAVPLPSMKGTASMDSLASLRGRGSIMDNTASMRSMGSMDSTKSNNVSRGGSKGRSASKERFASETSDPVGTSQAWVDGDTAKSPGASATNGGSCGSQQTPATPAEACNGSARDRAASDGTSFTTVLPADIEQPSTPKGLPPKLSDNDSEGEASLSKATILSEDLKQESTAAKQTPSAFTLLVPGTKSPEQQGDSDTVQEVRISGLGPLQFGGKTSLHSDVSECGGIVFEVLPVWRKTRKSTLHRLFAGGSARQTSGLPSSYSFTGVDPDEEDEEERNVTQQHEVDENGNPIWKRRFGAIHPNSNARALWDLMSLSLVSYDTAAIPMQLFDPPENLFLDFMAWWTRLFWSVDMLLSFVTGYMKDDGNVEMRLTKIAQRYVLTWFGLDLVIVAADWAEVILSTMGGVAGVARLGKSSRIFRILRLVRLMRLVRMRQVLKILTERLLSEILIILTDILKSMTVILGLAHLAACTWYGIGVAESETTTWVKSMPGGFETEELGFRYAASLHWSLSQFSGGMDEIAPKNPRERIYAIAMFLLAFVVAAIFVSSLTSSMTRLLILGSQQNQNTFLLRRYLYQNGISNELSLRIQRNALYALAERQKYVHEGTLELLTLVSEPLRQELHFELYSPMMKCMLFCDRYMQECPHAMRKICHRAVNLQHVSHGDVLFTIGEIPACPRVYFIVSGELQYVFIHGKVTHLEQRQCVAEATLWTQWMHRGVLRAMSESRLAILDATIFQDIAIQFDHPDFSPKLYASEFVHMLNHLESEQVSDLPMHDCVQNLRTSSIRDSESARHSHSGSGSDGTSAVTEAVSRMRQSFNAGVEKIRGSLTSHAANNNVVSAVPLEPHGDHLLTPKSA